MKLEGITVCKDYGDFLEETLPRNIGFFDRYIVVTHPSDTRTRNLCRRYAVDCVVTEAMHDEGDKFNKGRCINLGIAHSRGYDWLLHLDADIVLPHNFRNLLHRARIKPGNIYGADRLNVFGYDHWMKHQDKLVPHYEGGYFIEPKDCFKFGARIIHHEHGYTPIGFFQLWHASEHKRYMVEQGIAEHSDVLFACLWERQRRVLMPEVLCYHLESNKGPIKMGTNWAGRKTPPWGPEGRHHEPHRRKRPYTPDDDDNDGPGF